MFRPNCKPAATGLTIPKGVDNATHPVRQEKEITKVVSFSWRLVLVGSNQGKVENREVFVGGEQRT